MRGGHCTVNVHPIFVHDIYVFMVHYADAVVSSVLFGDADDSQGAGLRVELQIVSHIWVISDNIILPCRDLLPAEVILRPEDVMDCGVKLCQFGFYCHITALKNINDDKVPCDSQVEVTLHCPSLCEDLHQKSA